MVATAVTVSPTYTGPKKVKCISVARKFHRPPMCVSRLAVSRPGTMRRPKRVWAAKLSSVCSGFTSHVAPINSATSPSVNVRVNCPFSPTTILCGVRYVNFGRFISCSRKLQRMRESTNCSAHLFNPQIRCRLWFSLPLNAIQLTMSPNLGLLIVQVLYPAFHFDNLLPKLLPEWPSSIWFPTEVSINPIHDLITRV